MTGHARSTLIAFVFAACAPVVRPETAPDAARDTANVSTPAAMEQLAEAPKREASKPVESPPPAPPQLESSGVIVTGTEPVEPLKPAAPVAASWDIEVKDYLAHDRVDFYVRRFTGSARPTIVSWMQRGMRYEPMIRKTFREAGIPEDMYYLGLVESGYDPHAYSRAAAVGMWQFMTATARGVGLRVDWWVDERRDPMKSTKAAARFLSSLHDQFGSYYLAAAAMSCGT